MLKLEKVRTSRGVAVRLREKEKFFSKTLLRAAFLALALHLLGFIVFRVHSAYVEECIVHVDPSMVDTDISQPIAEEATIAQVAVPAGILPRYVLEPEPPLPKKPQLTPSKCRVQTATIDEISTSNLFTRIEQVTYDIEPMEFSFPHPYTPVTIEITGALANQAIIHTGTNTLNTSRITQKPTVKRRATYHVQIDNSCGKIFCFDKEGAASADTDRLAEAILKRMRFAPMRPKRGAYLSVTDGTIEITVETEEGHLWDEHLKELGGA